ncbi:MAG: nuclease-related domain-containing protein [Bacteroidota bacterium]
MSKLKGWFGEKVVAVGMWAFLDKQVYRRFHDVIVSTSNGTTQIDHILVSQYGIFVIETKNMQGWIFGSEQQASWTQSLYGKKYKFQNPLRQNYRHIKCLAEYLQLEESFFHSVVFFIGECSFKTSMPENVLNEGLSSYINSHQTVFFSNQE